MTTAFRVFHHAPRPIQISEFKDAVDAICRPRFPTARFARPQRIGSWPNVLRSYMRLTLL
jgi:hypothetical protein